MKIFFSLNEDSNYCCLINKVLRAPATRITSTGLCSNTFNTNDA
jgi:hypothetical protein